MRPQHYIRRDIQDRALSVIDRYDQRSHHMPCAGCGKPVHSEYCYDWVFGFWGCDKCRILFWKDMQNQASMEIRQAEESVRQRGRP